MTMSAATKVKQGRGRPSVDHYVAHVQAALLRLDDAYFLADSPLCALPFIQKRLGKGHELYGGGRVLQRLLRESLDRTINSLDPEGREGVLRLILVNVREGKPLYRVATEDLGRSREIVQKKWWPRAARAVTQVLLKSDEMRQ
jgi:hypothetical protein